MELLIKENKENKFFSRKELKVEITGLEKPITKDSMKEEIAKKLMLEPGNLVIIKATYSSNKNSIIVEARSYNSKEALMANEPKYILIRNKLAEKEGKNGKK